MEMYIYFPILEGIMKKKQKRNFLIKNLIESWNYIKESKSYIFSILGIFIIFALLGAFMPAPEFIIEQIKEMIRKLSEQTSNLSLHELILFILKNNFSASLSGLILGIFLGIVPIILAIVNGYVLGYVCKITVGATSFFELWRLLPHGIFELFAVFISLGLGIKLGFSLFLDMGKIKNNKEYFKQILSKIILSLKALILIILPLLILAAVIEGVLIKTIG